MKISMFFFSNFLQKKFNHINTKIINFIVQHKELWMSLLVNNPKTVFRIFFFLDTTFDFTAFSESRNFFSVSISN